MVERFPVRLRLTQEEAERYVPPKGMDISWIRWEKPDVVVCEFVSSELHPQEEYRKTAADLRHEVGTTFRNRIITDNLTNYPIRSRRALAIYTILQHPFVSGRGVTRDVKRAADAATDVHESEYTREQVKQMEEHGGLKPGQLEPKESRFRKRTFTERTPEGDVIEHENAPEEVLIFDIGMIDSG